MKDYHRGRRVTCYLLPEQLAELDAQPGENRTARLVSVLEKRKVTPAVKQVVASVATKPAEPQRVATGIPTDEQVEAWVNVATMVKGARVRKLINDRGIAQAWPGWRT